MSKRHKQFERYVLFTEVAKQLSFAKAAEKLDISRSYLSSQINALEKELGVVLLARSTRSVSLTDNGAKLLNRMQKVDETLLEVERELSEDATRFEGTIRITAPGMLGSAILPAACIAFNQTYPKITFEIELDAEQRHLDKSLFDIAIRSTHTPPDNMIAKPLTHYRHVCCASPDFIRQHGLPETPSQITDYPCLMTSWDKTWTFYDGENVIEVAPSGPFHCDERTLLTRFALQGAGIVKAPDYSLKEHIDAGRLIPLLEAYTLGQKPIYLIYPERHRSNVKINAFIEQLIQQFNA
ncbi:LysR family transcriptional regulator [Thaumasiovibrio subtropicus]|uniref:LysR family transcriptional regulator n=1 Tax=Thaumasiovibrio subtropicus TaxID=1891207 RepID=UPI000B34E0F1|nr:LysR family transcriptional regulator [Thaumasiovibrio subtropicus]